jgi:hypothetical protein
MEAIQAIILFVLGIGAAFLAYFAWHHTGIPQSTATQAPPSQITGIAV